jgi:Nuclease-related domain
MITHPTSRSRRLGIPSLPHGDRLAGSLGARLDDGYHWFRSVAPGGMETIDAVLVGPGGTFAITTAGERGRHTRRNGHWYRWNRSTESWVPWDPTPITTARLAARRLSLYLERAALPASVTAVLVPPAEMEVEVPRGEDIGVVVEAGAERLAALASVEEALSQQQVDRIVALLDPRQPLPQLAQVTPGG